MPIQKPEDSTGSMYPAMPASPAFPVPQDAAYPVMGDQPAPMPGPTLDNATVVKPPTRRLLQMLVGTSEGDAPDMSAIAYAVGGGPASPDNSSSTLGNTTMPMMDAGGIPKMLEMVRSMYYTMGVVYMPPAVMSDGPMCPPSFVPNAAVKGATPVDLCTTDGSFLGPQMAGMVNPLSESQHHGRFPLV
jgi:hypothetical protein